MTVQENGRVTAGSKRDGPRLDGRRRELQAEFGGFAVAPAGGLGPFVVAPAGKTPRSADESTVDESWKVPSRTSVTRSGAPRRVGLAARAQGPTRGGSGFEREAYFGQGSGKTEPATDCGYVAVCASCGRADGVDAVPPEQRGDIEVAAGAAEIA